MYIRPLLEGIVSYIPGLYKLYKLQGKNRGMIRSARYSYSAWLRRLVMADKNGLSTHPNVVAELGPGGSLGIGLAALLTGADKYYALDIAPYAEIETNIKVFDELVDLFMKREEIPDIPRLKPYLDSRQFPSHILTSQCLNETLKPKRIEAIRKALLNLGDKDEREIEISYFVPWYDANVIRKESVDMVYSQAVLEHVDNLTHAYGAIYCWLKAGGIMSHQIDFKSHGTAREWNGHWRYSDFIWKLTKGKRRYLLNRHPHSTHIRLMQKYGFQVVSDMKVKSDSLIQRKDLSPRFKDISDDDLTTSGAFIQAVKDTG